MINIDGVQAFGFFEEGEYGYVSDKLEDMAKMGLFGIDLPAFFERLETLEFGLSSAYVTNAFTGKKIRRGIYEDGKFCFPSDYVQYLKEGRVGFPAEYAAYLKTQGF